MGITTNSLKNFASPDRTKELFQYQLFDRRKIEVSFTGGDVSSDGGVMIVSQADHLIVLTSSLNQVMKDPRDPSLITHDQKDLLKQRIDGLTLGYEDLNDHDTLRKDLACQTAVQRDEELAAQRQLEPRPQARKEILTHEVVVSSRGVVEKRGVIFLGKVHREADTGVE